MSSGEEEMNILRAIAGISSITLLSGGCATDIHPEKLDLVEEWSNKMAPYQLTPMFPARDTVELGDVYLVCELDEEGTPLKKTFSPKFMTPLVGFQRAMRDFYSRRLELPKQTTDAAKLSFIDVPRNEKGITAPGKWTHLGLASFPSVFQVEGRITDVDASMPTGFGIFGLGGQRTTAATYILSMPAAEYQGLDALDAEEAAQTSLQCLSARKRQSLLDHLEEAQRVYGKCARLVYIRELYLARHMTLSYGTSRQSALTAQAKLYIDPNSARGHVQAAMGGAASAPGVASAVILNPASDATIADRVSAVEAALSKTIANQQAMLNSQVAGGQISSAAVSEGGISFDYTFSAPVAIGASLQYIEPPSKNGVAGGLPPPILTNCPGPVLASVTEPPAGTSQGSKKGKHPPAAAPVGGSETVSPDKSGPQLHVGSEVSPGLIRTLSNRTTNSVP
ncbi:hypothetical protein [Paraburkholderia strydomiana]